MQLDHAYRENKQQGVRASLGTAKIFVVGVDSAEIAAGTTVADSGFVVSGLLEFVWAVVKFDTENQLVDIDHVSVASEMVYSKAARNVDNNLGMA